MKRERRRVHVSPSAGIALVALVAASSGGAYAAVTASQGTIVACVHRVGGGLYEAHSCARRDQHLVWNAAGPRGPQGPAGSLDTSQFYTKAESDGRYGRVVKQQTDIAIGVSGDALDIPGVGSVFVKCNDNVNSLTWSYGNTSASTEYFTTSAGFSRVIKVGGSTGLFGDTYAKELILQVLTGATVSTINVSVMDPHLGSAAEPDVCRTFGQAVIN